ncbi:hypothetical protein KP509_19G061100 [Ceratopteris richardii]|uniref:RRM domain-containing protein n=1 Tax=Ceratopteris richardii TaxID=49495 RepID=A0A8T2SPH3_CERRI|nr:hypothetical protein KP509_19G061100 [Ceratopteris richardii]KAH7352733.1 hypothetical protein KP509_19G061100 [Ceratopteris richardii]
MAPAAQKKGKKATTPKKDQVTPKKQQQQSGQEEVDMKDAEEQNIQDAPAPHESSAVLASASDARIDADSLKVSQEGESEGGATEADKAELSQEEGKPEQDNAADEVMEGEDTGDVDEEVIEEVEEVEEEEEIPEGAEGENKDVAMQKDDGDKESDEDAQGDADEGTAGEDAAHKGQTDDSLGPSNGKIFIGGLSRETTTEVLTRHFEKYGELTDSVIMKNRSTGQPRGFGFVTYADPSIVDRVLQDTHVIDGRTVDAKRTVPREKISVPSKGPKTKKIFVGGLTSSTTEDDLKAYFSKFGKISGCQIMQDHKIGKSRGFGFVTFDSEQVVEDVLAQGKMHEIDGKQVEIKKAEPKRANEPPPPVDRSGYMGGRRAGVGPGGYAASTGFYGGFHPADTVMYGGAAGGYFNRGAGRTGGLAYGDAYGFGGGYGAHYGYGEFDEGYGSMNYGHAGYGSGTGYGYSYGGGGGYGSTSRSYSSARYHPYR